MKARIAFYFAAVVALVLFLAAAVPSHATQHRDPALPQDSAQKTQSAMNARPSSVAHASELAAPKVKQDSRNSSVTPTVEAKDKTVSKRSLPGSPKTLGDVHSRGGRSSASK